MTITLENICKKLFQMCCFILIFTCYLCHAQNTDSIIQTLKLSSEDSNKVIVLNKLSRQFSNTGDNENAFRYANEALSLSQKISFVKGEAIAFKNIGNIFVNQSNYSKGLENYLNGLRKFEAIGDKQGIGKCYGSLGNIFQYQKDYTKALEYYSQSLKSFEEIGDKQFIAASFNNIGELFRKQFMFSRALDYDLKALKITEELGDKHGIANCYNNIGIIYTKLKEYEKALDYYLKSLRLREEIGDKQGLGGCYNNLGELYLKLKDYKMAFHYSSLGLQVNKQIGNIDQECSSYENIADAYAKTNKYKEAYTNYVLFKHLTDTIFSTENSKMLGDLKTKFEVEKREAELKAKAEAHEALTVEREKRQTFAIYGMVALVVLVLVFAIFMYNRVKIIQKQKQIIEDQKHLVEENQKEIIDSITYAKRIQQVLLTSEKYIGNYVKEFFILFKPKDIVSGDFYWASSINNKFYLVTADCTGHGVPGAFMSMLGINFLNEIIIEKGITKPDIILNNLRTEIIQALNPEGSDEKSQDGMDLSLCCFDFNSNTLEYASANNDIYIVRNNSSLEVIELKADKMPVGMHTEEINSFTYNKIKLEKGDVVYTFTDGFPDQFGGPKGKKFKYKQFSERLSLISQESMLEQKTLLSKMFDDWKGSLDQVDDVCVIGIRV